MVKPPAVPLKKGPAARHRFQLILLFKHWEPDYIIRIALQGELVRLEAVRGGHLAVDNRESTFDDALAESLGLHGGAGDGYPAEPAWRARLRTHRRTRATPAKPVQSIFRSVVETLEDEVAIKLEELDGNDDDEDDDDRPAPAAREWYANCIRSSSPAVVCSHSVRWVEIARASLHQLPATSSTNAPVHRRRPIVRGVTINYLERLQRPLPSPTTRGHDRLRPRTRAAYAADRAEQFHHRAFCPALREIRWAGSAQRPAATDLQGVGHPSGAFCLGSLCVRLLELRVGRRRRSGGGGGEEGERWAGRRRQSTRRRS